MKEALQIFNEMKESGIIKDYAIGGAIAAARYIEAVTTEDLDIWILMESDSLIADLNPLYSFLRSKGYHQFQGEGVMIGPWPVQFLLPPSPLVAESIVQAEDTEFEGVKTRVLKAEYVVAISLETGRHKDFIRINGFLDEKAVDPQSLQLLIGQHNLTQYWEKFLLRSGRIGHE
ncbi:MAG: hypothetical protein SFY92_03385 [Verrucomicrobiae bacterium]|nr:hypothetical protein [Verrucomicrobiae bacterium]